MLLLKTSHGGCWVVQTCAAATQHGCSDAIRLLCRTLAKWTTVVTHVGLKQLKNCVFTPQHLLCNGQTSRVVLCIGNLACNQFTALQCRVQKVLFADAWVDVQAIATGEIKTRHWLYQCLGERRAR